MSRSKNVRPLDTIAIIIHKLDRGNIFDVGDLLLEAKAQCEHGQWLDWLDAEFEGSEDTAERKMHVAELGSRFRSLRNLKLAPTTLYLLADEYDEDDLLPAIIAELAKHATKTSLKPHDAKRVIKIGIARHRFGDHPDATLGALVDPDLKEYRGECWHEKAVAALLEREPETDEDAKSIVDEIEQEYMEAQRKAEEAKEAERKAEAPEYQAWLDAKTRDAAEAKAAKDEDEAKDEAESIIDGASPDLPPPTVTAPAEMGKPPRAFTPSMAYAVIFELAKRFAEFCESNDPEMVASGVPPYGCVELCAQLETVKNWVKTFGEVFEAARLEREEQKAEWMRGGPRRQEIIEQKKAQHADQAAADKKETAPPPESKTNIVADMPDIPACLDRRPTSTATKTEADKAAKAEAAFH